MILQWGLLSDSSYVTNTSVNVTNTLPISLTTFGNVIANGSNNGGSSWSNIYGFNDLTNVTINAWIQGTGCLEKLHYVCIGI